MTKVSGQSFIMSGSILRGIKYATKLGIVLSDDKTYTVDLSLYRDGDEALLYIDLLYVNKYGVPSKHGSRNLEVNKNFMRYLREHSTNEIISYNSIKAATECMLDYMVGNEERLNNKEKQNNA